MHNQNLWRQINTWQLANTKGIQWSWLPWKGTSVNIEKHRIQEKWFWPFTSFEGQRHELLLRPAMIMRGPRKRATSIDLQQLLGWSVSGIDLQILKTTRNGKLFTAQLLTQQKSHLYQMKKYGNLFLRNATIFCYKDFSRAVFSNVKEKEHVLKWQGLNLKISGSKEL